MILIKQLKPIKNRGLTPPQNDVKKLKLTGETI